MPNYIESTTTEQAFISALYNSLAIIFLIVSLSLCALLVVVLQVFVRSILWALLTGAFLFKLKRYLTEASCNHLELIENYKSCLTFQIVLLPFKLVDSASDYICGFFWSKKVQLIFTIISVMLFNYVNLIYEPFVRHTLFVVFLLRDILSSFVFYVDSSWYISVTIILGYSILIIFYWNVETKFIYRIISIPVWMSLLILISQILGKFRMFFLIFLFLITCIGIISQVSQGINKLIEKDASDGVMETNEENDSEEVKIKREEGENLIDAAEVDKNVSNEENKCIPYPVGSSVKEGTQQIIILNKRSISIDGSNNAESDRYFKFLFWLYVSIKLWSFQVLALILFIIIWKSIKLIYFLLKDYLYKKIDVKNLIVKINNWISERKEILTPTPFKILLNFYYIGDYKLNRWLRQSISSIISAFMILALLSFIIIAIILLAIKVQDESLKLISIISDILNENIYSQPQLKSLLPEKEKINDLLQKGIDKLYEYGREWLKKFLKNLSPTEDDQMIVKKQILSQWDMIYRFFSQKRPNITAENAFKRHASQMIANASSSSRERNFDYNSLMNENYLNFTKLGEVFKNNIGVFMSIADSFYLIFKSNINIFFTVAKTAFQSGFAVLNFIISFFVYITALFYLLSSSTDLYKPLDWLNEITIFKTKYGQLLSKSVEESIRSVFVASIKMATFYGFYTWLIHYIFGLSIVFLPSIFASIFAFLPILSTYWVSLPGILELWLLQDQPFNAILFLICSISPSYVVDMAIYSEIKGGHPYFTGLAIAGGIYCLGLEGALIGPIILCLFIVIIRMNKEILMKTAD